MHANHSPRVPERIAALAPSVWPDELRQRFVTRFFDDIGDDELAHRSDAVLRELLTDIWHIGAGRAPGEVRARVHSPRGYRSVAMLVQDDMPFLVDTVRLTLARHGCEPLLMVHPMLRVRRDSTGAITELYERSDSRGLLEAWTFVEFDRVDADAASTIESDLRAAYADVAAAVADWAAMKDQLKHCADRLAPADAKLAGWLAARKFVILGAAQLDAGGALIDGSALGIVRNDRSIATGTAPSQVSASLRVFRTTRFSTVHRHARLTCVRVVDAEGGECRIFGLLSAPAYRESATATPRVQDLVEQTLRGSGYAEHSHSHRVLQSALETFPRDDLFEIGADELQRVTHAIVAMQERGQVRALTFDEPGDEVTTCLVYVPLRRIDHSTSTDLVTALERGTGTRVIDYESTVQAQSTLARYRFSLVHGSAPAPTAERCEQSADEATTDFATGVERAAGDRAELVARFARHVPKDYTATHTAAEAMADFSVLSTLSSFDDLEASLTPDADARDGVSYRFKVYRSGDSITLSAMLPLLESLGFTVVDQLPYEIATEPASWIYDIGVRLPEGVALDPARTAEVVRTFEALFRQHIDNDGLNRLVLLAGLTAREVDVLRAYTKYLRQITFPYSQPTIEAMLARMPDVAARLCALFDQRFSPSADEQRRELTVTATTAELELTLDGVPSLDDDRIGRAFIRLIHATLRTNAYRTVDDTPTGAHRPVISLKFDPSRLPDLPLPRPMFEVFVSSPHVEGVHLRGGKVARGGLRWSDRREDFRTEVLGLMKAQMVKNAVIVPVGAKGGFVVKQPPPDADALRATVVECYKAFVRGLLDVTDNIVDGVVVHPPMVVRYDAHDPYLVVAADKGTATFSDTANALSAEYGFWLGDAFASGGSAGYDHKAMAITSRGAWESVRRHARIIGKNADADELTVVGIGDMSGDVFGNGLLRSPHVKLLAAFDHRHVFIDPTPDPALSYKERQRLFALPRSSWADYDTALISEGGGVYPRSAKVVELSAAARRALGIDAASLAPTELISAILKAPVDLLWNGGIGTYVKAAGESHAEVGDRANDAVRINGRELRCKMVGEGGNLGFTQRARIEYALNGGLVNTDAIDNSAGVDCSDHEVNIKILLNALVGTGRMTIADRDELLASMTDEVAEQVLDDNQAQTLALTVARRQAVPMVNVHARYIRQLEQEGFLNRAIEFLPTDEELADRQAVGGGLTVPEFAVLLAYTKAVNVELTEATELPEDPYLVPDLMRYFPSAMRDRFAIEIGSHRLRREIVTTQIVNQMVNMSGISFDHRMTEETGASVVDVTRAWLVARDVFGYVPSWQEIEALGSSVSLDTQLDLLLELRRMVERSVMWLLRRRRPPLALAETVEEFSPGVAALIAHLAPIVKGGLAERVFADATRYVASGVSAEVAERAAIWPLMHTAFDVIDLARRYDRTVEDAALAYWSLFERLDVTWLWDAVGRLPRVDRWQTHARAAVRDDLLSALADLTADVLAHDGAVEAWATANERAVRRVGDVFGEIRRGGLFDLTTLSVALRQLRNLVLSTAPAA